MKMSDILKVKKNAALHEGFQCVRTYAGLMNHELRNETSNSPVLAQVHTIPSMARGALGDANLAVQSC